MEFMSSIAPLSVAGLVAAIALLAMRLQFSNRWRPFAFSCWVLVVVVVALGYPSVFQTRDGQPASYLIMPLIQLIMFGMGTTLGWRDFRRVGTRYPAVLIGMVLQFTIMPLMGWGLARLFRLTPEMAVGVVLIGSCPGGVASNVITFLSRGDVALSVSMTACSTLLAPLMTPLLMSLLVGAQLDVPIGEMMRQIATLVVLPTLAGIVVNEALARRGLRGLWLDRGMSLLAMVAICWVIGIIVAQTRAELMQVGVVILVVAAIHNACGLWLGYAHARLLGLTEAECRAIAFEVGMQNGGMGTALAIRVLQSPAAALAPAIFAPWMSVTGALLASYWRKHPPRAAATIAREDGP